MPHRRVFALFGLAFLAAFALYAPGIFTEWWWDDNVKIFQHPLVTHPNGLRALWTTGWKHEEWPVTQSVFWLLYQVFGAHPPGFRGVNVLLHTLNAGLWLAFLRRAGVGRGSPWIAAIAWLHPLAVETVLWATEIKTTLATSLGLGAGLLFLESGSTDDARRRRRLYAGSLVLWTLAMGSKTAVVGFPLVWLLAAPGRGLRGWPRIVPHLAIGLAGSLWTMWICSGMLNPALARIPEGLARVPALLWAGGFYLWKFLVPVRLNLIYPHTVDVMREGGLAWWGPLALGCGVLVALAAQARRDRLAAWALLSMPILLAPVSGLFLFAYHMHSMVADHFAYPLLPMIALGYARLTPPIPDRAARGLGIAVLALLASLTAWRAWETGDSLRMMRISTSRNPAAWAAWSMYGEASTWEGMRRWKEAEDAERLASVYEQESATGALSGAVKDRAEEIRRLRAAAAAGKVEARRMLEPALALYRNAVRVQPGDHVSWFHLGRLLSVFGESREASECFENALRAQSHLRPAVRNNELYQQAAAFFARQGDLSRARAIVAEALPSAGRHPGLRALAEALGVPTPP